MDVKFLYEDTSGHPFVKACNYGSRLLFGLLLLYAAPGVFGVVIALSYILFIHPLVWKLGDKFREFAKPDFIITNGALDTFNQQINWMVLPQLGSVFVVACAILLFGFGSISDSNRESEVVNAKPMKLNLDSRTGYFSFNVNSDSDFGSPEFKSAARIKPILLTGGVTVELYIMGEPTVYKSDDKNMRRYDFGSPTKVMAYVPLQCISALSARNKEIMNRIDSMPKTMDPANVDMKSFVNNSCDRLIDLRKFVNEEFTSRCRIDANGMIAGDECNKIQNYVFVYKDGFGLKRSYELEAANKDKYPIEEVAQNEEVVKQAALLRQQEASGASQPGVPDKSTAFTQPALKTDDASSKASKNISPSFDCAKAKSQAEILICTTPDLASLDNQVYILYKKSRDQSASPETVKADQIAWIKSLQQCKDVGCLQQHYQTRIAQLGR